MTGTEIMKHIGTPTNAKSFRSTQWGLRFLASRKVIDIQVTPDKEFDVTVYATGCKEVLDRVIVPSEELADTLNELIAKSKGFNNR